MIALSATLASMPAPGSAQDRSIFSVLDTQGRSVAVGAPSDGILSDQDVLSAGGRRVQVWALSASPGSSLRVDLRSSDFDAFLYVVGPGLGEGIRDDDGGDGLNSRLCLEMADPGEYRIVASSLSGGTGAFTLEVSEAPGATNGACADDASTDDITDLAELPTDGRQIRVGDDIEGFLGADDFTVFEAPAQAWAVEGREGAPFSVDLISDAFDAYLMVEGPGFEEWLQDDDGAGRCDSRLTFVFPETGTFRVVVSTLDETGGSFRLVASEQPGPPDPAACIAIDSAEDRIEDASDVRDAGVLPYGETVNASMTGSEGQYSGRSMQAWSIDGTAGARIAIEMRSADFDSYLYFFGPGFTDPLSDDDGAGDLHSRICVELPETGGYRIFAGPLSGDEAGGRFTLFATQDAEERCDYFEVSPERVAGVLRDLPTSGRTLSVGANVDGVLADGDERHPESGRLIQAWALDLQAGERAFVDVVSSDFDAVLYAMGPGFDEPLYNDDAEGCLHSRIEIVAPVSGTFTIIPGAFSTDASGDFALSASTEPAEMECGTVGGGFDAGEVTGNTGDPETLSGISPGNDRRLQVGTEMMSALSVTSETLGTGQPAEAWTVAVNAGEELVFELLSDDFDSVLYLDGPSLFAPLTDDDGAGGLDSRIVFVATQSGTIRLVASALTDSAFGDYRIRAIRRAR